MDHSSAALISGIKQGDRKTLAKAITMVESHKSEHHFIAEELLEQCLPISGNSIRLGITGVPGVGKSTFIEAFGSYLIEKHQKKVAVLAVDPSSSKSKGSILGDKTRMAELAANENAFIRPSPSSGNLGGVGLATRESIVLCEAAGYDAIIVETVGVGQSETEVRELVDFFMLLMLPGAGDELQGIKRGIVELADAIFINKSDGDNMKNAREAKSAYSSALSLFQQTETGWKTKVEMCSALTGDNLDLAWKIINDFESQLTKNGMKAAARQQQLQRWFSRALENRMLSTYYNKPGFEKHFAHFEQEVEEQKMSPRKASRLVIEALDKS